MWRKSGEKQHKWLGNPNETVGNGGKTSRKLWETMRKNRINGGFFLLAGIRKTVDFPASRRRFFHGKIIEGCVNFPPWN